MDDYDDAVISFGSGVNSVAMTIMLVNSGWNGPIVMADTGTEHPDTYCYMDAFERDWLEPKGLEITRLKGLPWQKKGKGVSLIEYCEMVSVIPLAAVRWCTVEWKVYPIERWKKVNSIEHSLLGIAADESHRKPKMIRPLCDEMITREGCYEIIEGEGLMPPRKSGCYICPFQRLTQWRELYDDNPSLFERAAQLEEGAVRGRKSKRRNCTLDPSGKYSLRDYERAFEGQSRLFDDADWQMIRRFQPCECTV